MEYLTFTNGQKIPKIGLGLWKGGDSSDLETAIDTALEIGYRHFDTALFYETEDVLGKSINKWIQSGKGKREDLFIVTKLPWNAMQPELVEHFINLSLKELQTPYIDLYLIHWPCAVKYTGDRNFVPTDANGEVMLDPTSNLENIWKAMEAQVDAGKAKAIGISNFTIAQTQRILDIARIHPENSQVEIHAYFQQPELLEFCKKKNITVCAYSPLGGPWRKTFPGLSDNPPESVNLLDDPIVKEIAEKHSRTPGQILLRFLLELGVVIVPKSAQAVRLQQNLDLFTFALTSDDLKKLKTLEKGPSGRSNFPWKSVSSHPECPF